MSLEVKIGLAVLYTIIALLPILVFFFVKKRIMKKISRQNQVLAENPGNPAIVLSDIGAEAVYHKISPQAAKEMMDWSRDVLLLDVRSKEEYLRERIPGSILLPDDEILEQAPITIPDKKTKIIVYCLSGVRSQRAAKQLVSLHYTDVHDMGGMLSWPFETIHG